MAGAVSYSVGSMRPPPGAPSAPISINCGMYIVTGGAGFIGSNLVRALNQRGIDDILVVDDLTDGEKHLNLNALDFTDFVDWRDLDGGWEELIEEDVEAVFHQGANSDTMERDGAQMMHQNFDCSKQVLFACLDAEVPLFYASSASVYGGGEGGFREELACEDPLNVYAYSKFLFDQFVRRVLPEATSQVVGLRYFNVYGPQEMHKGRMASVMYHFHNQIQKDGQVRLFEGSEGFRRDFIHVDDVVAVNMWLLENPEVSGIFNCGTGTSRSFLDIAEIMKAHSDLWGTAFDIETVPFPEALVGKYQAFTEADLGQLRAAGFDGTFTSLEEGVLAYSKTLVATGGRHRR